MAVLWRGWSGAAPPHDHTGYTWHHGDALLFTYTKLGGAEALAQQGVESESGMPGFGDNLSDQEIWNIISYIESKWPDRIREIQATRTEAEQMQLGN
ncbi:c-type cytochrome [Aliiruegeria lutimaris]|uniref:c-type cytochrome n=1 Tax=Aliiruegeria lutimaris TaxID=571298 RepID=UPI003CC79F8F